MGSEMQRGPVNSPRHKGPRGHHFSMHVWHRHLCSMQPAHNLRTCKADSSLAAWFSSHVLRPIVSLSSLMLRWSKPAPKGLASRPGQRCGWTSVCPKAPKTCLACPPKSTRSHVKWACSELGYHELKQRWGAELQPLGEAGVTSSKPSRSGRSSPDSLFSCL